MLEILAQATQPAAQAWWIILIERVIGPVALVAVGLAGGYYPAKWVRIGSRKAEVPCRALGALEECTMLCTQHIRLHFMADYLSRVSMIPRRPEATTSDTDQLNIFLEEGNANVSPLAASVRRLITSLGELKGLYIGNRAVINKLGVAIATIKTFKAGGFEVPWSQMSQRTPEQLAPWVRSQQLRAKEFVAKGLERPVKAAIDAVICEGGDIRWPRLKKICNKIRALLWRRDR